MPKGTVSGTIRANGHAVRMYKTDFHADYLSLTDIAKCRSIDPHVTVHNWLRNRDVVEFLGVWEAMYNPDFNLEGFGAFQYGVGRNAYVFSIVKWRDELRGIGLVSVSGRNGGIYAHVDIALAFASWISAEFWLCLLEEYKCLKSAESSHLSAEWSLKREIARLESDADGNLIPPDLTSLQITSPYASEAELLHVVLFGQTAKEWKDTHPGARGDARDHAGVRQMLVLSTLEPYNAQLISMQISQAERIILLRTAAVQMMQSLAALDRSAEL